MNTNFETVIQNYIERQTEAIKWHNIVRSVLEPLVGKEINARTLNAKRLEPHGLKFNILAGMYYIISPNGHHLIGYSNSENLIAVEKTDYSRGFEYFDTCCGAAAQERIDQLQDPDKHKTAKQIFEAIDRTYNELRTLFGDLERNDLGSYHFPAYYDILRSIEEKSDNLKLSDFYYIRK